MIMQEFELETSLAAAYQDFVAEIIRHQDFGAHIRSVMAATPEQLAIRHLLRGEEEGLGLTFGDLDRTARSLGALFQARRAQGERAIMLFETGVEPIAAFLGCLYARVV